MNLKAVLLVCACIFVSADAAAYFYISPGSVNAPVQEWSDWVFVECSQPPTDSVTLSLAPATGNSFDLSTTTLTFGPSTQTASFRVFPQTVGALSIVYTLTDASGVFTNPANTNVNSVYRAVTIEGLSGNNNYVNRPSQPLKITIQYPSTGDLTFTPSSSAGSQVFNPTAIVIPAGSAAGSYVSYFNTQYSGLTTVTWTITGDESALYNGPLSSSSFITAIKRSVYTPTFSSNVLPGVESGVLYAYITDQVNTSFSLTVEAADTTFTPSVLQFTPGVQVVNFTFNTTTPQGTSTAAQSPKAVIYTITDPADGSNEYAEPNNDAFNVPRETITVVTPSIYIQNKETHMSLRIPAPVDSDLTVLISAANVIFTPTNVTFSGLITSFDIAIMPIAQGTDVFSFTISGTDVDYYNIPASVTNVVVTTGEFIGPDSWYIPYLTVGVTSDKFPVAVNVAPDTQVILIPTSPDLIFSPTQAVFTSSSVEQWFTITPSLANTASSQAAETTTTISFIVTGDQATLFTPPGDLNNVVISRRNIQFAWSPHIFLDNTGIATLYLQKHYIVWATANYADKPVTVTPVSPYVTFSPSVLTFSSGNLIIKVTATVTGVAGLSDIDYIISGENGGLYANIESTQVYTELRPFTFYSAVIAPDNRVAGITVYGPSATDLAANHIYAFTLQSPALPESKLNIIPHSSFITFSPNDASVSSNVGFVTQYNQPKVIDGTVIYVPNWDLQANFTMTPLASGCFETWFELTGADAPYYAPPPHTFFCFSLLERATGETVQASAATSVAPHIAALFIILGVVFGIVL